MIVPQVKDLFNVLTFGDDDMRSPRPTAIGSIHLALLRFFPQVHTISNTYFHLHQALSLQKS